MREMNRVQWMAIALAIGGFVGSCASHTAQTGELTGGAGNAAADAGIGSASGNAGKGALIGGAVGLIDGGSAGSSTSQQETPR